MLITLYPTRLTAPAGIADIDFTSKHSTTASVSLPRKGRGVELPTETELNAFYEMLNSSSVKPAILKIIPCPSLTSLPTPISQLYYPDALGMNYLELLSRCEEVAANLKVRYFSMTL